MTILAYFGKRRREAVQVYEELIEQEGLRSGGRGKEVIRVRKISCQLAVRRMGYPGAEMARYLGVTPFAVNRLAALKESWALLE